MTLFALALLFVQGTQEGGDGRAELTEIFRSTMGSGSFRQHMEMAIEQNMQEMKMNMSMTIDGTWQDPDLIRSSTQIEATMDDQPMVEQEMEIFSQGGRIYSRVAGAAWTEMDASMMGGEMQREMLTNPMGMIERMMERVETVRRLDPETVDGVRCVVYEMDLRGDALVELMNEMGGEAMAMMELDPEESSIRYVTCAGAEDRLIRRQQIQGRMVMSMQGMDVDMQMDGTIRYSDHGNAAVEIPGELPE